MKFIVAAGGTGGHLYPAIAMAEKLKDSDQNYEILLVGTQTKIDEKIYKESGFDYRLLAMKRPAPGLLGKFGTIFLLLKSIMQSLKLIQSKNDVVIACGGFGCVPIAIASRIKKCRLYLLEQNAIPGRVNIFLARFAQKVFCEFPDFLNKFQGKKLYFLGNPIRKNIKNIAVNPYKNRVLFMGGSQGAKAINDVAFKIIPMLSKDYPNFSFTIITGENKSKVPAEFNQLKNASCIEFINNIEDLYKDTFLLIGRSGATSIAETAVLGIPSILIPYPYAKDDHQKYNAKALVDIGAAIMMEEEGLQEIELKNKIIELIKNKKLMNELKQNLLKWAKPNAATEILDEILT